MADVIVASLSSLLTWLQTLGTNVPAGTTQQITHNGYNLSTTINGTVGGEFIKSLVSGAGTIDLTAFPGTNGVTVSGSGLKVLAVMFTAPSTNANIVTLTFGASNPYNLFGAAWNIGLLPGQSTGPMFLNNASPTIGSGAKNIDLAGTGSQGMECVIICG